MDNPIVDLKDLGDIRGLLVAIEGAKTIPFEIKRTYFLVNMRHDLARGFHAHQKLQQFAVCLKGSCRFIMDDGIHKNDYIMSDPTKGIFIDANIWHEMHDFSEDCVLLVIASDHYDENDYVRDYDQFIATVIERN